MQRPSRWEHDVFINHFQICLSSTTVTSSQRLVLFPSSPEETDCFKLHIYCGWNDAKEERLEKHSQRRRIPGEKHEENTASRISHFYSNTPSTPTTLFQVLPARTSTSTSTKLLFLFLNTRPQRRRTQTQLSFANG